MKLINFGEKPQLFLEISPEGKVPLLKGDNGKWIPDSDVITQIIEEKFPYPSLVARQEYASVGSKIFPSFAKFLTSKDPNDGSEQALVDELRAMDEHLKEHGPFIDGEYISDVDLSLASKLFHLKVTLDHFEDWSIPEDLLHAHSYMERFVQENRACREYVIAGWKPKVTA